jgi:hypothetical protein
MARSRSSGPQQSAPRSDAYVGLLAISLVAQVIGAIFLYLDWSGFPDKKPTSPPAVAVEVSRLSGPDDAAPPKDGKKGKGGKGAATD